MLLRQTMDGTLTNYDVYLMNAYVALSQRHEHGNGAGQFSRDGKLAHEFGLQI